MLTWHHPGHCNISFKQTPLQSSDVALILDRHDELTHLQYKKVHFNINCKPVNSCDLLQNVFRGCFVLQNTYNTRPALHIPSPILKIVICYTLLLFYYKVHSIASLDLWQSQPYAFPGTSESALKHMDTRDTSGFWRSYRLHKPFMKFDSREIFCQ